MTTLMQPPGLSWAWSARQSVGICYLPAMHHSLCSCLLLPLACDLMLLPLPDPGQLLALENSPLPR